MTLDILLPVELGPKRVCSNWGWAWLTLLESGKTDMLAGSSCSTTKAALQYVLKPQDWHLWALRNGPSPQMDFAILLLSLVGLLELNVFQAIALLANLTHEPKKVLGLVGEPACRVWLQCFTNE